jgi:hypothetical protein
MKKAEQFLIAVVILGFLLDFMLIPGGKWVLIIGIAFLSNIYLFDFRSIIENLSLSDYNKKARLPKKFELNKMLPGYAIVSLLMGMLFNFKTWPGGNTILMIGFAISLFSIYLLYKEDNKSLAYGAIKRIVIYSLFGIVFYALPEYFWLEKTYHNYPEYIQARKDFDIDPEDETLRSIMEEEYEKIK